VPAVTPEARERARAAARAKYAEEKRNPIEISTLGAYRGPRDGTEEKDSLCPGCGKRYMPEDFSLDEYGNTVEPFLCLSCRCS